MKPMLRKELRLALHPTNIIFLSLSAMLIIPNYPYYVTFFYTTLGLFFLCLNGRENHDIEYSLALPVRKTEIVRARIAFAVLVELAQVALAVPFALLRQGMQPAVNEVGMDANMAFFGLSLLMLGLFNRVFFPLYYRAPAKVGKAFLWGGTAVMLYIILAETLDHMLPFVRDVLDTPDPQHMPAKLAVLAVCALAFAALTWRAYSLSARRFEALDL